MNFKNVLAEMLEQARAQEQKLAIHCFLFFCLFFSFKLEVVLLCSRATLGKVQLSVVPPQMSMERLSLWPQSDLILLTL